VQADAYKNETVFDVLELAGDTVTIAREHRDLVSTLSERQAGKHEGSQRERQHELSDSHALRTAKATPTRQRSDFAHR